MYNYQEMRKNVFTEDGVRQTIKIRDEAKKLIKLAGVVQCDKLIKICTGDTWDMLACIDYLVETKDLLEIKNELSGAGQHRIFTNYDWQIKCPHST